MGGRTPRQEVALNRIRDRLADLPRHRAALDLAIGRFSAGFPVDEFAAAVMAADPTELERANLVQAAFENTHNHLIGLAEAVSELVSETREDRNADTCLRVLKGDGVITEQTRKALSDAQRVRSRLQHIYMDVEGSELHEGVKLVHSHAQPFLDDVVAWLRSNGYARTSPG